MGIDNKNSHSAPATFELIGRNVSSGVYFFQLKTSMGIQEMRKMLLLR